MLLEQVPVLPRPPAGTGSLNRRNNTHAPGTGGPAISRSQDKLSHGKSISAIDKATPNDDAPGPSAKRRQQSDSSSASKRKRSSMSATPTDNDQDQPVPKEKKKKASRACCHCQKAHLTCDDSRPCQRCVKRGIADTCAEGHRKKAKYLLDDEELEALRLAKEVVKQPEVSNGSATLPQPATTASSLQSNGIANPTQSMQQPTSPAFMSSPSLFSNDPIFNLSMDHSYPFDSTTANLEYSMLSAILGNPSAQDDANATPPSPPPSTTITNLSMMSNPQWPSVPLDSASFFPSAMAKPTGLEVVSPNVLDQLQQQALNPSSAVVQPFRMNDVVMTPLTPPASDPTPASPVLAAVSPDLQMKPPPSGATSAQTLTFSQRAARIYTVTEPFDYVDGYHFLMQYLQGRFDKMDILRIVRALAIFRPSLIALQMDMSREDEIFAEKCFQRTILELEKLISFSGTPTVVWRRTGEICLVGVEFTMLTEWTQEDLVTKHKFIYELFEHQSVVEYWEKFASHAFESSSQSVNSHCVLLKPSGEPIPCAFCFSIKRDVFDLPNVIIGQWLPLL